MSIGPSSHSRKSYTVSFECKEPGQVSYIPPNLIARQRHKSHKRNIRTDPQPGPPRHIITYWYKSS